MKIKLINKKLKKNYNCFNFDRVRTCLLFLVFDERVCGDLHSRSKPLSYLVLLFYRYTMHQNGKEPSVKGHHS